MSFAELQTKHKLPKATLHKLLVTLEKLAFLRRDETNGRYSIGYSALELAAHSSASPEDLPAILGPIMERLVQEHQETCHLGIIVGGEEVMLKRLDPPEQIVRVAALIARRHPAHATAGGLASLATLTDEEITASLPGKLRQLTPNTVSTRPMLLARLKEVRAQGYALDLEEAYLGVRCVGIAVAVNRWPTVHLSFSLPLQRASFERLHSLAGPLTEAAKEIERILSVTPPA